MTMRRSTLAACVCLVLCVGADRPAEKNSPPFPADLVSWTADPANPLFTGTGENTWDQKIRERGWILKEGETFHLWYTGYNDDLSPNRLLGHATSTDGSHWVRDLRNPLVKDLWVEDVCVIHDGDRYVMFAEGPGDIAHLLTSPDGITWTAQGPLDIRTVNGEPISAGPRGTPTAWKEAGVWNLFYERGDQGVWLARSTDLKTWTNVQDEPVLSMGPAEYDRHAVAVDQILKRDGVYYAFYHANSHKPWTADWTTCLARSADLIHWEKYPGNPLIRNNSSSSVLVPTENGPLLYTAHPEVRRFLPAPPKNDGKAGRRP
jgi:hypothetical protein